MNMYIWHVFLVRPFAALSLLICLAAIFSCWTVLRKPARHHFDRFLIGFVGLLSIYQGLRLLRDCGLLSLPASTGLSDAVELLVTAFYLMATMILRLSSNDRLDADSALRLAKAAPPPAPLAVLGAPDHEIVQNLKWALPRLSDGAFKLYAYLNLHADHPSGRVTVNDRDLLVNCGRTEADEAAFFSELQALGTSVIQKNETDALVQIGTRSSP